MKVGWKGRCADVLSSSLYMALTPEQLKAGIEYFQILANIKRRLILEGRLHELEEEQEKRNRKKQ